MKDLDLIVGGHSHSFLWSGSTPPEKVKGDPKSTDASIIEGPYPTFIKSTHGGKIVPVTSAYFASRYMGHLQIIVDKIKGGIKETNGKQMIIGSPLLLGGNQSSIHVHQEPEMMAAIKPFAEGVAAYNNKVIGFTKTMIDNTKSRIQESMMGDFVCDAAMDYGGFRWTWCALWWV